MPSHITVTQEASSWADEIAALEAEQAADLAQPALSWWEHRPMSYAEWLNNEWMAEMERTGRSDYKHAA